MSSNERTPAHSPKPVPQGRGDAQGMSLDELNKEIDRTRPEALDAKWNALFKGTFLEVQE